MSDGRYDHLEGIQRLREANDRLEGRARILDRLDVDPWRLPADGLLEYDPVHDEWRIEVWRDHLDQGAGRLILRRYAGRRNPWADLSPYIAGEGTRVWWRAAGDLPDPPSMRDLGHGGHVRAGGLETSRADAHAGAQLDAMNAGRVSAAAAAARVSVHFNTTIGPALEDLGVAVREMVVNAEQAMRRGRP